MRWLDWLKGLFRRKPKAAPQLPMVSAVLVPASAHDGGEFHEPPVTEDPYRTAARLMREEEVSEDLILAAERALEDWLIDGVHGQGFIALPLSTQDIAAGATDTIEGRAQCAMQVARVILFASAPLSEITVTRMKLGASQPIQGGGDGIVASCWRMMSKVVIGVGAILQPGMHAAITLENHSAQRARVRGVILGKSIDQ